MKTRSSSIAWFFVTPVIESSDELVRLNKRSTLVVELSDLQNRLRDFSDGGLIDDLIMDIQHIKESAKVIDSSGANLVSNKELIIKLAAINANLLDCNITIQILYEGRTYQREVVAVPRIGEYVEVTDLNFAKVIHVEHHLDGSIIVRCASRPKAGDCKVTIPTLSLLPESAFGPNRRIEPEYSAQGIHRNDAWSIE